MRKILIRVSSGNSGVVCKKDKFVLFNLIFYVSANSYGHVETVSLPNHTFFPGETWPSGQPVLRVHTFTCNWQKPFLNQRKGKMTIEIRSISTKVWDLAEIKLVTPGSAVRLPNNCARKPSMKKRGIKLKSFDNIDMCRQRVTFF